MRIVELKGAGQTCHACFYNDTVSSMGHTAVPEPAPVQSVFSRGWTTELPLSPAPMAGFNHSTASHGEEKSSISFLDLPCEIRLQIYHLVHLSSPVQGPQLAPWYQIPTCRTHTVQAVLLVPEEEEEEERETSLEGGTDTGDDENDEPEPTDHPQRLPSQPRALLSPHRPLCYMPTAVLQTCRHIHAETRMIPFHENEFVFINWFSSGLSSALAFMRGRQAWQRGAMRFVRLEVFASDVSEQVVDPATATAATAPVLAPTARTMWADRTRFTDWVQLCGFWSGLKGLRLAVWMEGGGAYQAWGAGKRNEVRDPWELVSTRTEWIRQGLAALKELRQLEVELADVKWTAGEKVKWCEMLREALVSCHGRPEVTVVCVGKLCK